MIALLPAAANGAAPQQFPASVSHVLVLDRETKIPIAGAKVLMVAKGVREDYESATVMTDTEGKATLKVARASLPMRFGDGYFAGGYLRSIEASFDGYKVGGVSEGPNGFGTDTFVLELKPIRNRYGAVRVAQLADLDEDRLLVTFDILDGPRAGTELVLPMFRVQRSLYQVGMKFYLEEPIESLEKDYAQLPSTSFAVTHYFREAVRDEAYAPPVE